MPSGTQDKALITQFSDMLHVESQQINSRLRPFVKIKPMVGDRFAYDGLGTVEAREVNGRIVETTFDDIDHTRRKIRRRRFVVTLPIDSSDVRGMLIDPQGDYAQACIRAMERQFDRVGVEAAFANVDTGREFDTEVTFASDGGLTVDATSGATYEKLLELNRNWTNNDVGNEVPEQKLLLISGDEEEAFLQETELTSGDFTRQFAIEEGRLRSALGIKFLVYGASVTNPILDVNSGTRDCVGLTSRGLAYGLSKEMSISIDKRPDFVELKQVQIVGELGAVRTEGVLVQKFQTTD